MSFGVLWVSWFRFSSFFPSVADPGVGGIWLVSSAPSCAWRKRRSLPGVPFSEVSAAITPPPCAVHAGRCGQQAGGMHPTGIQSRIKSWKMTNGDLLIAGGFWKCYTGFIDPPPPWPNFWIRYCCCVFAFLLFYFAYLASTCDVGL